MLPTLTQGKVERAFGTNEVELTGNVTVSHGTSHATTKERYQYTTSVDINNTRYKRIQSLIQNHMRHVRSESAGEQKIALHKKL